MNSAKILKKLLSGVIIWSMFFSTGINALASQKSDTPDNNAETTVQGTKAKGDPGMRHKRVYDFNAVLSELVKEGTLTKGESDKISAYLEKKQAERKAEMKKMKDMTPEQRKTYCKGLKGKQPLLSELVSSGIITQVKADAIKSKLEEKAKAAKEARLKEINDGLGNLVQKGTITQAQANKVMEKIKQKAAENEAIREKIKNMTPEQREAYFEGIKKERKGMLQELVDNKTLTQSQADAVKQIIKAQHKHGGKKD